MWGYAADMFPLALACAISSGVIVNLELEASNLDQTGESAVDNMVVVGGLIYERAERIHH